MTDTDLTNLRARLEELRARAEAANVPWLVEQVQALARRVEELELAGCGAIRSSRS